MYQCVCISTCESNNSKFSQEYVDLAMSLSFFRTCISMTLPQYFPSMAVIFWISKCSNPVSSCESMSIRERLFGIGCAWDNPVVLAGVEEHECVLRCLPDKTCTAVNYDVQNKVCTRSGTPCPVLETQSNVNYQILATVPVDGCVQWVATHDWNYPRIVKVNQDVGGDYPLGVTRLISNGDILPAKWPNNNANVYTIKSGSVTYSSTFEVLAVNKACSLRWVYYDASSSDPLPTGAIQGGHWSDGTPLYVALIYARADRHVVRYYNHATRMGTCDYSGENNKQNLELLIVP